MSKRVMVASRAVRRGRRLKARSTMPPPPKDAAAVTDAAAANPIHDEPSQETAIDAPESGEGLVGERRPGDAPADGLEAREEADEADEADGVHEADDDGEDVAQPAALDDAEVAQVAHDRDADLEDDDDDEKALFDRISGYSRPPAPAFDFGAEAADDDSSLLDDEDELDDDADEPWDEDDAESAPTPSTDVAMAFHDELEEPPVLTPITRKVHELDDEPEDPNATTLVSVPSPRHASSPPPPSRITIEEAAPSSERLDASDDEVADAGFIPEGEEPPLSEPSVAPVAVEEDEEASPSSPIADVRVGYRDEDASLAPVVDDLALEEEAEVALFDAAAEKRRHAFRRGVGVVLAAIVVGTVALIGVSAFRGDDEVSQAAAAPAPVDEPAAPVTTPDDGEAALAAAPTETAPEEADAADEGKVDGDYEALSAETLELLNDREFERARELAEKLVALEPDNAFGYRCLGSALQDMGKVTEARDAYSQCVTKATKGEVTECRALGGSKR